MELPPELQEKKIFLIEGLKRTYKGQYDAIQPIPYVKDRLYCVDKVFVEGGVEVCLAPELTRGTGGSWERLESYKSIYTDFRFKSKRRIIQGESGYGKSTLTLQLAYDWCNDVSDSPMNHVEILILLRLRQLGSVKCLFRAIKLFLLYHEPRVSIHDIEKIIHSCSSVHITLDGYDEYPGRDSNVNDDVHRIIKMELFADFDVSLTTRYLPEYLRKETKRAKLTGFDDKARGEYIRKAVVGNNNDAVEKIKQRLYANSILADLCQVPLIFVMFAHMAHDQRDFMKFKSVTHFFKHLIRCFYNHLNRKRKLNDRHIRLYLHEMEHHELDKIAFEELNKENQQLSWIKTEFCERVGPESYHQYISIGILVEEDEVSDDSTVDNVLYTTMVRFYHKLFCEWYAAHHFVTLVKNAYDINETLRFLDPVDLQYLFRFACGLDPNAGKKLINHLKRLPGGDTFAILCILEQTGDVNEIMDSVKDLCSRDVKIQRGDSALLQRSMTQLLEIASNNDIPISCLHLDYSSINLEGDTMLLHSGISLPILPTVEKIHIAGRKAQHDNTETLLGLFPYRDQYRRHGDAQGAKQEILTEKDILKLFIYGMNCRRRIKELMFDQLHLPTSIAPEAFTNIMKTRNIQVRWRPFDIDFHLDLQTGHWEVEDNRVLENICSSTVSIDGSVLQQRSAVQLLHVAHRYNIPMSCLHLEYSSIKIADNNIILHSGISLPTYPTVEKIHIAGSKAQHDNTETLLGLFLYRDQYRRHGDASSANREILTENDILNLFRYGMKCPCVKELVFDQLHLPTSISPEAITNIMKTRNIQVQWRPFDIEFHLDLQNGHWEFDNIDTLHQLCSDTVNIRKSDDTFKQKYTIMFINIASRHEIPISCLQLDYSSIKFEGDTIILHSGISLPILPTVEKIHIAGSDVQHDNTETYPGISYRGQYRRHDDAQSANQDTLSGISYRRQHRRQSTQYDDAQSANQETLTEKDVLNWFRYGMKCRRIKELMFGQLQLPNSVSPEAITNIRKTRNIQVRWRPFDIDFHLDLQSGQWEVDDIQVILNKNSGTVSLSERNNILQDTSTLQLLEVARNHDIPISCLYLEYSSIKLEGDTIILHSRIPLPILPTVEKIHIAASHTRYGNTGTLTDNDLLNLFHYGMKCGRVKEMMFDQFQLPTSSSSEAFKYIMKTKKIQVRWRPFDIEFHLDEQNGHWEVDDIQVILNKNSGTVSLSGRNNILQDMSTLQLLEVARNHDVPVSCLHLEYSSIKFEGDTLILSSGIPLPKLPTVEKIHIAASNTRYGNTGTVTDNNVLILFHYGMKCGRVKEMMFDQLQLPSSFSPEAFTDTMKTKNIQVRWRPFDIEFHLDQHNGHWEVDDIQVILNKNSGTVSLSERNNILQDMSTLQLLEVARNHDIPVSCLHLEYSSIKFEGDTIILHSGIPLPILPTVEKIHIAGSITEYNNTESLPSSSRSGRQYGIKTTLTNMDVLNFYHYGMKCGRVKELMFNQFQLPTAISPEAFTDKMKTQKIQVRWCPFDIHFHLDLETGHWKVDNIDTLRQLCSDTVHIRKSDDTFKQKYTFMFIHNASSHEIPISCLDLKDSFREIDAGDVILHSGLHLSCPVSVKKVVIQTEEGREMTETEVDDILMFVQQSHMLEELEFDGCVLPLTFSWESILSELQSRKIKVFWSNYGYSLDLQSGIWKVDDVDTVKRVCTEEVNISRHDSELLQRCTIKLLENASYHDIPISCLYLDESFSKIDASDVILHSWLRLSCPATVKKVVIQTEKGREMTETEVVDILTFVQQSHQLEELEFDGLLPSISSSEAILAEFKTRDIKVLWMNCGYSLNFQSGAWEVDVDTVQRICTQSVSISSIDSASKQRCTRQLLENASAHGIPISCLHLIESFSKIDAGDIILNSGIRLSCPVSVKKVVIHTEEGREMTETEVVDILMFVQQSHMLEELEFKWCLLPQSISAESIPSILKSKNVKVTLLINYTWLELNLQSGGWMRRGTIDRS